MWPSWGLGSGPKSFWILVPLGAVNPFGTVPLGHGSGEPQCGNENDDFQSFGQPIGFGVAPTINKTMFNLFSFKKRGVVSNAFFKPPSTHHIFELRFYRWAGAPVGGPSRLGTGGLKPPGGTAGWSLIGFRSPGPCWVEDYVGGNPCG